MSYDIKPFKDEVLCDVAPLKVCDVLLGQPYMWRCHVVYKSRPHSIIVTLGGQLYRIPEVVSTIVPPKQCHKVISHTAKFILFTIRSKGEQKDIATIATLYQDLSIQQKKIDKIVHKSTKMFLLHLRGCLHTTQSSKVIKKPFILFMLHLHQQSPFTLKYIMKIYCLNRFNPPTTGS
jgi:hypothetical protein